MTFDEWFNQIIGYGLRCEWFFEELRAYEKTGDATGITRWLKAAYEAGSEA